MPIGRDPGAEGGAARIGDGRAFRRRLFLLVDDDDEDVALLRRAVERASVDFEMARVENGVAAVDYLLGRGEYADRWAFPLPDLVLLDLNMPRMDGKEALRELKTNPVLLHIPVVALTCSSADSDVEICYRFGANSYVRKPAAFDDLVDTVKLLGDYWCRLVRLPDGA